MGIYLSIISIFDRDVLFLRHILSAFFIRFVTGEEKGKVRETKKNHWNNENKILFSKLFPQNSIKILSYLFWGFIPIGLPPLNKLGTALITLSFCHAAHPSSMLPLFSSLCQYNPHGWTQCIHGGTLQIWLKASRRFLVGWGTGKIFPQPLMWDLQACRAWQWVTIRDCWGSLGRGWVSACEL